MLTKQSHLELVLLQILFREINIFNEQGKVRFAVVLYFGTVDYFPVDVAAIGKSQNNGACFLEMVLYQIHEHPFAFNAGTLQGADADY